MPTAEVSDESLSSPEFSVIQKEAISFVFVILSVDILFSIRVFHGALGFPTVRLHFIWDDGVEGDCKGAFRYLSFNSFHFLMKF